MECKSSNPKKSMRTLAAMIVSVISGWIVSTSPKRDWLVGCEEGRVFYTHNPLNTLTVTVSTGIGYLTSSDAMTGTIAPEVTCERAARSAWTKVSGAVRSVGGRFARSRTGNHRAILTA